MKILISFFAISMFFALTGENGFGANLNKCEISAVNGKGKEVTIELEETLLNDRLVTRMQMIELVTNHDLSVTEKIMSGSIAATLNRGGFTSVTLIDETIEGIELERRTAVSAEGFAPQISVVGTGPATKDSLGRFEYSVGSVFGSPNTGGRRLKCRNAL